MLQRYYFAEYERMSKKVLKYRGAPVPLKLMAKFEQSLYALREHLYQNKMRMPIPLYPYDEEDVGTHAYIRDFDTLTPIPNPNYVYRGVWKRIDGLKGIR